MLSAIAWKNLSQRWAPMGPHFTESQAQYISATIVALTKYRVNFGLES
jgi:hypothetical protein